MNQKYIKYIKNLLFILVIIGFIYVGTRDFSKEVLVDNEKFDEEYTNVSKENVFKYVNHTDVLTKFKGDAIIFMGYPTNKWTGYYANILNEAAKQAGITEILYYDFYEDRLNQNGTYQSIVLKLSNHLPTLDDGTQDIYAPTLVLVKNGKIVAFDNETAINKGTIKPEEYWNEFNTGMKLNTLVTMFNDYLKND